MPRGAVALRRGASPSRIWQLAWPLVGSLHARRPLGSDGNEGNSPGPRRRDRFFADLTPTRRRPSSVAHTPPWVILFGCRHFALFCCYRRGTLGSGWLLSRPGCALSLVSGDASAARLQCPSPPAAIRTAVSFQPVSSNPDAYPQQHRQDEPPERVKRSGDADETKHPQRLPPPWLSETTAPLLESSGIVNTTFLHQLNRPPATRGTGDPTSSCTNAYHALPRLPSSPSPRGQGSSPVQPDLRLMTVR
ncbi:hypothetical protein CSOJ01_01398 [Colletotrichum sojae]|uniref:Uncharacterized protein n=1 Tax=Colletotrichum sojae TaxID=2175907 RepID=A0A8H6JVA1_9PEZI|nr:hypothetical protein CSOJ01_01398 [Colletotrichum sojae]